MQLPLLITEKIQLSVRAYNPHAFIGIIENIMPFEPNKHILNLAYQQLVSKRTHLNVVFKRDQNGHFYKQMQPLPFLGLRELKNQKELEYWRQQTFDASIGPLYALALLSYRKLWVKKTHLYFKFSHLIFDGFSLFYFFKELYALYQKLLSNQETSFLSSDLVTYQSVMKKYLSLEKTHTSIKEKFWKAHLKMHSSEQMTPLFLPSENINTSFALSKESVQALYDLRKQHNLDALSILTSLYYKALQKVFGIQKLHLRVASSFRQHLTKSERCLLANLALSFPLTIHAPHQNHALIACENKKHIQQSEQHLPLSPLPWSPKDFQSFSIVKNQSLTFALSCFVYRKNGFLTSSLQQFQWLQSLTDMTLMVGLCKESMGLFFTYKKNIFEKTEIQKLYQQIKTDIPHLPLEK